MIWKVSEFVWRLVVFELGFWSDFTFIYFVLLYVVILMVFCFAMMFCCALISDQMK